MHEETVYDALTAAHGDDARWAFGSGFDDPLAGVDTTVPEGVDAADLGAYCLMLGDDALVLSQRLTEWLTRSPELEEEVAFGNLALDQRPSARVGREIGLPHPLGTQPTGPSSALSHTQRQSHHLPPVPQGSGGFLLCRPASA